MEEVLAAVSIRKTRTGMRIDIELSGKGSKIEDMSYLMILEKTVRMKQKELSMIIENEKHLHNDD